MGLGTLSTKMICESQIAIENGTKAGVRLPRGPCYGRLGKVVTVWEVSQMSARDPNGTDPDQPKKSRAERVKENRRALIKAATELVGERGYDETSIARITELNNAVTQAYPNGGTPRVVAEALVLMLAPLAPHMAEVLWSRLGHPDSLAWADFPVADEALLVDDTVEVPVQVNGKLRSVIIVQADSDAAALEAQARADAKVIAALDGRETRRVVAVPGRLVNFVV